ncbi:nuclease SbcCD subunit C-like [Colletes gigas]|uniref:nuclease SbcCD subunit C-like n=1 Tax=Colletes gigas TaxID=935657 RepID=UPI001C9BA858|nr:nuclease SbcCD subunit C-like [Colletes gigas]
MNAAYTFLKWFQIVIALALIAVAEPKLQSKKEKRGVAFGPSGYDFFGVAPIFSTGPWAPTNFGTSPTIFGSAPWNPSGVPDIPLTQVQVQATHDVAIQALKDPAPGTPTIAYPPDVLRAIQQASEANHNVNAAQQRVAEAKHAAVVQQKVALAKEAAAREAAARSQEISSSADAEARSSAKQLVALQQRLASLKDAVAAAQRVAAAREAAAAAAIQRNAAATAAELQKQDVDKQISQSEQEAKEKDVIAAKENAVANAVQLAALQKPTHHPWSR